MKIGFITCSADRLRNYFPTEAEPTFIATNPLYTPDDEIAVAYLQTQGYQVEPIIWGCPIETLRAYDLVVVRSPWDYMDSSDITHHFMSWMHELEQAGVRVANPSGILRWLLDKHYLQDLGNQGIAIIPTEYLEMNSDIDLLQLYRHKGEFILKPCISAAGHGLFHVKSDADAILLQAEMHARLQHSSYMLQDFIPEITTEGEWSLIFLSGKYSHAVHKKTGINSIFVHAERGGTLSFTQTPARHLIDFANKVYENMLPAFEKATGTACHPQRLLYLRIDIIDTKNGPVLIECEGVEPELFFRAHPQSEVLFMQGIQALIEN